MVKLNVSWKPSDDIALALSGGIDSMVLYHLLKTTYKDTYRKLYIFHVNHGARIESFDEEKALKKRVERDGFKFLSTTLNIEKFSQQKGRLLRYEFFFREMRNNHIQYCLTAHHKDDDFESIIFELLTSRYLHGVGIKEMYKRIVRPMLNVRLREIETYAHKYNVTYFLDQTNETNDYTRNYIRHEILTHVESHEALYLESLTAFKEDYNALVALAKSEAETFLKRPFKRSQFNQCNHILKVYILSIWLNVSRTYIEEVIRRLDSNESQFELPIGHKMFVCSYDDCYIREDKTYKTYLTIDSTGTYEFNGYKISVKGLTGLTVRTFQNGDRVKLKDVGTKKVSRLFIDKKISNDKRKTMPIIVDENGRIIAVGEIYNIIKLLNKDNREVNLTIEEINYDA